MTDNLEQEVLHWKQGLLLVLGLLLVGFGGGLGLGWHLWVTRQVAKQDLPPVTAPPVVLPDKAVVLAVQPTKHPVAKQQLPAGSKVEETIHTEIQPTAVQPLPLVPGATVGDRPPCPPVRVDLTLFRAPDGHRRVAASSPDGTVLPGSSLDIPEEVGPPAPLHFTSSAGLVLGGTPWGDKAVGAYYDHDWKFLRTGAEVTHNTYALTSRTGWELRVKLGVVF